MTWKSWLATLLVFLIAALAHLAAHHP